MTARFSVLAFACLWLTVCSAGASADDAWTLNSLPSDTRIALPLLLQSDSDAAPEWGVLRGLELTVADVAPGGAPRKYLLPAGTVLFDLRDTDRDGRAELAVVRAGRIEYWREANLAAHSDPTFARSDAGLQAISYGAPRPYPLFVESRGEDFVSVPIGTQPPMWTLEGARVDLGPRPGPRPAPLTQFNAWPVRPAAAAGPASQELHINQVFDAAPGAPPVDRPPRTGTRRARDAGNAPPEEWPWFPLGNGARVFYALAPPDYQDTLVRVETPATGDRRGGAPVSPPRRYPGILIPPTDGASDFDGDGLNDLLLWRAPRPGASMDSLVRAAQSGVWDVALTVHLFNAATGRFAARPIEWIHTQAPVVNVLEGGVRGPFAYLRLEDLNADGRTDLVCTGAGHEISAWKFTGAALTKPWIAAQLPEPIDEIVLTARVPAYRWLGIARSAHAFHIVALPQH